MRLTGSLLLPAVAPLVLALPQVLPLDKVGNVARASLSDVEDLASVAWDVIIIGAGAAGIVMADRMSEAGKNTLLLEQGGPSYYITGGRERPSWLNGTELSRVDVPGLYKSIYTNPSTSLLCSSSLLNSYSACTIGGCTAINAGLFFQPPASDFNRYFPQKWKSTNMQSAISKLRAKQPFTNNPSANGQYYLQTGYTAAQKWLVGGSGYSEVGINQSPNNKTKVFGHPEFSYVGGQRSGAVKTYLQSALARSNFRLQSSVKVNRVVRNGSTATGVEAVVNGQTTTISVAPNGRVILSGGALFSPQLLMLSGIGDPSQLSSLSANGHLSTPSSQWINNTAVGAGLFDNPNTFIELTAPSIQSYVYSYSTPIPAQKSLYLNSRSGPYAFASETSVFWDTIAHADGSVTGLQGTIDSSGYGDYTSKQTVTLNVYGTSGLLSTGKLTLDSAARPTPSKFFYSDPTNRDATDIATFIHAIFQTLPAAGLTPLNIPQNASIADIVAYITTPSAYATGNVNHWSSSCRLGSCVDVNTVVKGMTNLHVVDGSIVPPLTVNPSMGIMIAAERAAELILKL